MSTLLCEAPPPTEAFLDLVDDIAYRLDGRGRIAYLNRAGRALLDIQGCLSGAPPWSALVHEDDRPRLGRALEAARTQTDEPLHVELRTLNTRGEPVPMRHTLRAERGPDGEFAGILGLGRDLREVRRLEENLQHSQKLETVGMLASGIAHDFNNMLAAILGYTELMLEEFPEDDENYRALTYIKTSTERAEALVKQLRGYIRKSGFELRPVHVAEVVKETLGLLQRTLPKTIHIRTITDDPADLVMGDAGRLQQALMNLCLNARDAMPRGGELRIEVDRVTVDGPIDPNFPGSRSGDHVRIRVQDTGTGMPPEVLARIWDPFYTTKPADKGTGLGLALVRSIAQGHHGRLHVESQEGRGTTFYLYFPAATTAELACAAQAAEPAGGTETILVVDDEPVLRSLVEDMLKRKGYRVLACASGMEALETLDALDGRIDLVISDNMMPGMTGRELVEHIHGQWPRLRLLVCSGFNPTHESEVTELDYVSSYVQKPYQRKELLRKVRAALDEER